MYRRIISPALDRLDSETWHHNVHRALHLAERWPLALDLLERLASPSGRLRDPRLRVTVAGIELDSPVMVGAGWDKSGEAVRALYALGFSGVEVGTVVEHPQPGNPRPRQFAVAPGVVINRLGFNSPGARAVARNLEAYLGMGIPVGVSVGKNRDVPPEGAPEAHAAVVRALHPYASYFAINVSSPNTPGLRELQERGPLTEIVLAVLEAMEAMGGRKPLFVKIAPELSLGATDDVIQVVTDHGLAGIIATNTVADPEIKARYGDRWRDEPGGLSGDDPCFRRIATEKVAYIHRATSGAVDVIGVGGVKDAATALEKIAAGARAVQLVTALRGEGPAVAAKINRGLVAWMERRGVSSLQEVVGSASG